MAPLVTSHVPYELESPQETVVDICYDEIYAWSLLEDHPLRAPPTGCFPGLFECIHGCYVTARKNWGERLFRGVCLLLLITIVVQLSIVPFGLVHLLPHAELRGHGLVFGFSHGHAECAAYHLQAGRCVGVKVDIWMQNGSLWANDSMGAVGASRVLSSAYFESMLGKLDALNSAANAPVRSSILRLELQSPVEEAWPDIMSQLKKSSAGGYISYMNGTRRVLKPVTVVISSKDPSYLNGTNVTDSDIVFFDTSLESLAKAHQQAQSTTEGSEETDGDILLSTAQAANHGAKRITTGDSTTKTVMESAISKPLSAFLLGANSPVRRLS